MALAVQIAGFEPDRRTRACRFVGEGGGTDEFEGAELVVIDAGLSLVKQLGRDQGIYPSFPETAPAERAMT